MPSRTHLASLLLALFFAAPGHAGGLADSIAAGNESLRAGRVEEAKNHYAGGFVHAPEAPELHYSMGLAHLRAGERDKAAEFFRGAAERAESSGRRDLAAQAMYNLGIALAQGSGGAAESAEPPPAAATPGDAPAAVLGSGPPPPAAPGQGPLPAGFGGGADWKGALGAFEKAIRLAPGDLDAKYNYLRVKKRLDEMQQSSKQPGDPEGEEPEDGEEKPEGQGGSGEEQDGEKGQQGEGQENEDEESQGGEGQQDQKGKQGNEGQDDQEEKPGKQGQKGQDDQGQNSSQAPSQGSADAFPGDSENQPDMDRQAMERFLDAVEAESKDQLKRFLRGRRAQPKEVKHDW